MPIFEFECQQCRTRYEALFLNIKKAEEEQKLEKCPACGSTEKRKLVSQTNYVVRTNGFYSKRQSGG